MGELTADMRMGFVGSDFGKAGALAAKLAEGGRADVTGSGDAVDRRRAGGFWLGGAGRWWRVCGRAPGHKPSVEFETELRQSQPA